MKSPTTSVTPDTMSEKASGLNSYVYVISNKGGGDCVMGVPRFLKKASQINKMILTETQKTGHFVRREQ